MITTGTIETQSFIGYMGDVLRPARDVRDIISMGQNNSPEDIVKSFGDITPSPFADIENPDAMIAVIAAWNEEHNIPLALLSLARSSVPVAPLVAVNGSPDRTAEFSDAMGASVVELPTRGKSGALKHVFELLAADGHQNDLLLTDADIIAPKAWAAHMQRLLRDPVLEAGGVACGPLIYFDNGHRGLNVIKSMQKNRRDRQGVAAEKVRASGANMAVTGRGGYNHISDLATRFDPEVTFGIDRYIARLVGTQGDRSILHSFAPDALMYTRGDRVNSWGGFLKVLMNKGRAVSYTSDNWAGVPTASGDQAAAGPEAA